MRGAEADAEAEGGEREDAGPDGTALLMGEGGLATSVFTDTSGCPARKAAVALRAAGSTGSQRGCLGIVGEGLAALLLLRRPVGGKLGEEADVPPAPTAALPAPATPPLGDAARTALSPEEAASTAAPAARRGLGPRALPTAACPAGGLPPLPLLPLRFASRPGLPAPPEWKMLVIGLLLAEPTLFRPSKLKPPSVLLGLAPPALRAIVACAACLLAMP